MKLPTPKIGLDRPFLKEILARKVKVICPIGMKILKFDTRNTVHHNLIKTLLFICTIKPALNIYQDYVLLKFAPDSSTFYGGKNQP